MWSHRLSITIDFAPIGSVQTHGIRSTGFILSPREKTVAGIPIYVRITIDDHVHEERVFGEPFNKNYRKWNKIPILART